MLTDNISLCFLKSSDSLGFIFFVIRFFFLVKINNELNIFNLLFEKKINDYYKCIQIIDFVDQNKFAS